MSNALTWICRGVIALLAVAGGLNAVAHAQPGGDIVDDFKNGQKVAAQKLEQEIKDVVVAAKAKTESPAKVLGVLKLYKASLETDTLLTKDKRAELLGLVTQQIKSLQAAAEPPKTETAPPKKSKADEQYELYQKYGSGKSLPGSPSDTASKTIGGFKGGLDQYHQTQKDKEKQGQVALSGTSDLGTVPGESGVAFPKNWKQLSELHKKVSGLSLTKEEASLIKAMNQMVEANYVKQPFQQVIKHLEEVTGQTIIIDGNAMKALEIDYSTPITFQSSKKVSFRVALKKVLGDLGLAYILKNGVVQVVTPQVAQSTMTTQTYYVGDLIPPPAPGTGPFFRAAQEQFFANQIMQTIVLTVEPQSWAANGSGKGTIYYNAATKRIVISNSAELHLSIKASMSGGN